MKSIDEFSRVETITQNAIDEVMIGGKDIHEVFAKTARALDRELKNLVRLSGAAVDLKGNLEIFYEPCFFCRVFRHLS